MSYFSWMRESIAKTILDSFQAGDLTLAEHNGLLIWDSGDDPRIEDLRRIQAREIDDLSGISMSPRMSSKQHQRWMMFADQVPTIQDALNSRFGNPNVLFKGLTFSQAKKRWEQATDRKVT